LENQCDIAVLFWSFVSSNHPSARALCSGFNRIDVIERSSWPAPLPRRHGCGVIQRGESERKVHALLPLVRDNLSREKRYCRASFSRFVCDVASLRRPSIFHQHGFQRHLQPRRSQQRRLNTV
jgi:hypothetical protein